jgi:enoyl-[acyl-carrier protein] reductase / trans-2-enoyl-CoA reductase (NAD+)
VQAKVVAQWNHVTNDNLYELTDFAGYKTEFLRLFGFEIAGVDYDADVNPDVKIPGIIDTTV